jgi:hypothetical protein
MNISNIFIQENRHLIVLNLYFYKINYTYVIYNNIYVKLNRTKFNIIYSELCNIVRNLKFIINLRY